MILKIAILICLIGVTGCSQKKISTFEDPKKAFEKVCSIGKNNLGLVGSLWMRTDSPELKGQFPADIKIQTKPLKQFRLEITDLLGGVQAVITMDDHRAWLEIPKNKKPKQLIAELTWAGIPVKWASELFLGQLPCPSESLSKAQAVWQAEGLLKVNVGKEEFLYQIVEVDQILRVLKVEWKSGNASLLVDITDWVKETGEVLKWFVKSKEGELRIKWKDRKISSPN